MRLSRRIIILLIVVPVLVTMIYMVIMLLFRQNTILQNTAMIGEFLHHISERDADPLANEIFERRKTAIMLRISRIMEIPDMESVEVFDAEEGLIATAGIKGHETLEPQEANLPEHAYATARRSIGRKPLLRFSAGIFAIGERLGTIRFYYSLERLMNRILLESIILTSLFTVIPILLFISQYYTIRNSLVRPIQSIIESMKRIEAEGPGVQTRVLFRDEIGDLAESFNEMSKKLDVSYKKNTEQQASLQKSLEERELLIHDIHHRVKNNLAVILSLVRLEKHRLDEEGCGRDAVVERAFGNIVERISVISSIYSRLYQNDMPVDQADSRELLDRLVRDIAGLHYEKALGVQVECEADSFEIPLKVIIPLSLIVNEVLSNSYKHAFTGRSGGKIFVRLTRSEKGAVLVLGDDGGGYREDDVKPGSTLGLKLVDMLAQQIGAEVTVTRSGGVVYTLRLP